MSERKKIFLLFVAGVACRIFYFSLFADKLVVGSDQMRYITLARRFATGDLTGVLDAYWTPLYPFLIGVVSLFFDSLTLPSVIISVLAGGLAVPLTYLLVREFYAEREALIAAALAVFFPHLINSFFALGTENVYLLWMDAALLTGWRGLKNGGTKCFGVTGILFGLAYLTRPEAFAYPFFFAFLAGFANLDKRKFYTRNALAQIGALMLGFFICAAPYIVYLHSATGTWTISDKTKINTIAAELDEPDAAEKPVENGAAKENNFRAGKILLEAVNYNVKTIHQTFPIFIPPLLLMLVALGLFGEPWDSGRLRREGYLVIFCLITVLGYTLSVVQLRYFYFLLPIFFGWTAHGILTAEKWFRATIARTNVPKFVLNLSSDRFLWTILLLIYCYLLPLNFFMRSSEKDLQINAYEERDAGIWIKQNAGTTAPRIFSLGSRPVFYAEGIQFSSDAENTSEILSVIKKSQPDYIVVSERALKRHPTLKNFDRILESSPGFKRIYDDYKRPGYGISIYTFNSN